MRASFVFQGVAYESNSRLSLSHVVLLATSYVRLLVLILQKVSCNRLIKAKGDFPPEPLTFDDCIQWCIRCPSISRTHEVTTGSTESASPVTRLFEFFSERLRLSDNSTVADHILEVLSILALQENGVLMEKLLDLSWVSLHTIYVHTGTEAEQGSLPCALSESVIRFGQQVSSSDLQSLRCVVERTVDKLYYNGIDTIKGLHHLRQGMLRHWGLVTASPTGHSLQRNQLASMIAELASLLESLSNSIRRKNEEEKKESETSTSHKRKKALPPSIIGLDAATFPDFYKLLTHVVVAATATLTPVLPQGPGCSPYNHIKESFALFRRLIELYRRHIAIFPRKTAATVSNVSKDMLSVAVSLLQRCVEWRNSQPLLSVRDREAGKHDPGAIRFLEQFIGTAASHTAGTILNLCDFLQSHEAAHVSRSTTLRFAAEKAARRIKDVSISHNLAPPSFIAGFENFESDQYSMQQTKGFHQLEPVNGPKEKQHVCPLFVNSEMGDESRRLQRDRSRLQKDDIVLDEKAGNESEDSFGAAGDWGDDSDEDSESSLNLHPNSPFLKM